MKLPRRRYWMPLALLAVVLFCVRLGFDYHLIGLLRDDAYYRGMPTSYWRALATHQISEQHAPDWFQHLIRRKLPDRGAATIFQGGAQAQAVLLQMALDPATDHYVRVRAFSSCSGPALNDGDCAAAQRCLTDDDREIRHAAAHLLLRLNKSDDALSMLLQELPEEMCDSSLPKSFQRAEAYSSLSRLPATYPWIDIGRLEKAHSAAVAA